MTKISPLKFPVKHLFLKMLLFSEHYRTFLCLHSTSSYHLYCVCGEILNCIFPLKQVWEFLSTKPVVVSHGSEMQGHAKHLQLKKLCRGSECLSCPCAPGARGAVRHSQGGPLTGQGHPVLLCTEGHIVVSIMPSSGVQPAPMWLESTGVE